MAALKDKLRVIRDLDREVRKRSTPFTVQIGDFVSQAQAGIVGSQNSTGGANNSVLGQDHSIQESQITSPGALPSTTIVQQISTSYPLGLAHFGNGADGDITYAPGTTVLAAGANVKRYANVTIQVAAIVTNDYVDYGLVWYVSGSFTCDGQLKARALSDGPAPGAQTDPLRQGAPGRGGAFTGYLFVYANTLSGTGTIGGGWNGTDATNSSNAVIDAAWLGGADLFQSTYLNHIVYADQNGRSGGSGDTKTAGAGGVGWITAGAPAINWLNVARDYFRFLYPSGFVGYDAGPTIDWRLSHSSCAGSGGTGGEKATGAGNSDGAGGPGGGGYIGDGGNGGAGEVGAGNGTGASAAGAGSAGAVTVVFAWKITSAITLSSKGGNGGASGLKAGSGGRAGGAGGGGGGLLIAIVPPSSSVITTVSGGSAGAASGGGTPGSNGTSGLAHVLPYAAA